MKRWLVSFVLVALGAFSTGCEPKPKQGEPVCIDVVKKGEKPAPCPSIWGR